MYTLLNLPQDNQECIELVAQKLYPDGLRCPWKAHDHIHVAATYYGAKPAGVSGVSNAWLVLTSQSLVGQSYWLL